MTDTSTAAEREQLLADRSELLRVLDLAECFVRGVELTTGGATDTGNLIRATLANAKKTSV